jgi:hypothetical protein
MSRSVHIQTYGVKHDPPTLFDNEVYTFEAGLYFQFSEKGVLLFKKTIVVGFTIIDISDPKYFKDRIIDKYNEEIKSDRFFLLTRWSVPDGFTYSITTDDKANVLFWLKGNEAKELFGFEIKLANHHHY